MHIYLINITIISKNRELRLMTFYVVSSNLYYMFYIRDLLHMKKRRDDTCEHINDEIGEDCISCELELAGPEYESQLGLSSLSKAVCEELFCCELSDREACSQALSADITKVKKATITVDNHLSPAHTLLQIQCVDQKGLIYDILRTAKDCNIQVYQLDFLVTWFHLVLKLHNLRCRKS